MSRSSVLAGGFVHGISSYVNICPKKFSPTKFELQFIGVGGIIGLGFFANSSLILGLSGPGGTLLAFALVGLVATAVMEGICEMIVLWPISNAMVEFVRAFVDEDLAIVVGVAYW